MPNKINNMNIPNNSILKSPPSFKYSLGYFPPEKNLKTKYPT